MKFPYNKPLPYLAAFAVFGLICILYFMPQFDGMTLFQSDLMQLEGMKKDIADHVQKYGEHPQWAGNMFGGMPSYLIDFDFAGRPLRDMADSFYFLGLPSSYIFLAMAGFFLMLLCFGVNPWLGIIGGIMYGLSTYFVIIIHVGHITKMVTLAYVPVIMGAVWLAYRRNMWWGAVLAAVSASIAISINHPQIIYYFGMVALALVINEGVRAYREKTLAKFFATTALLVFAAALAVGSNAMQLWYTYQDSKESMRGGSELASQGEGLSVDYATQWSYGKAETFNLFIPGFTGGGTGEGFSTDGEVASTLDAMGVPGSQVAPELSPYWGDQPFTEGPVYIGAVVIFLFVLGMFLLCGVDKWWILAITAIGIMLAWGHNLMWFTSMFFDWFPMYGKFRTVSMILVIAEWSMPLVAVLVLQKLWNGGVDKDKFVKALKNSLYITGGVALFFALFGGALFDFSANTDANYPQELVSAMQAERADMLRGDSWRSLVFVLLTAGAVLMFFRRKIKGGLFVVIIAGLALVDMAGVDMRYVNHSSFVPKARANVPTPSAANLAIMEDPELGFRVADMTQGTFNSSAASYFHRSVGGYHGNKLSRYQDIITHHLSQGNMAVYSMLDTKYFITPDESGQPVVQINPDAAGAAWFVDEVKYVSGAQAEIDALGGFDPSTTAVVDERFRGMISSAAADSTAVMELTDYKPNHLTYTYSSPSDAVAVFSEIYYPKGWTAYIDGVQAPYFRADYILRAMQLPAGEHKVEFRFEAPGYARLAGIGYVCSYIIIGGAIALAVTGIIRKRRKK